MREELERRPKVGLALGAGAAKGYAHIGVIKVLEKHGIPIDIITGSSIGSLIGALYASGVKVNYIESLAYHIKRRHFVDITFPRLGLIAGNKIEEMLRLLTKNRNFDELNIPLGVVATDLKSKRLVLLKEGNVALAVRASIAIPGIFCPVMKDGMVLVDGGVLERVPGRAAREMGADVVIGVELGFSAGTSLSNIYDIIFQTFEVMGREIQFLKNYECDVLITPNLENVNPLAFSEPEKCIKEGIRAAEAVLPQILTILGRRDEQR
ncbi:patatin-like phospholipase family protein [Fervidicola ferrireducens]|jgi:NTE family protein|uniref:patatin-like phospholipase family protein n=1 Tax=Fervidicola ferrireducens TaxID=520764 RepID=UPI00082AE5B2|nr:patatin-like phospholipase family protein [Fervidicola ferrireducens]